MSNRIIAIAAGLIGLAVAALPQVASAQTLSDGPTSYRPYVREDFRPVGEGTRYDDGQPGYGDEYDHPHRPHHERPRHDEDQAYRGFGGPDGWDRPVGGYGYRPVAAPGYDGGAVYATGWRHEALGLGCTVQRSERDSYAGGREIVTTRRCYAR